MAWYLESGEGVVGNTASHSISLPIMLSSYPPIIMVSTERKILGLSNKPIARYNSIRTLALVAAIQASVLQFHGFRVGDEEEGA